MTVTQEEMQGAAFPKGDPRRTLSLELKQSTHSLFALAMGQVR